MPTSPWALPRPCGPLDDPLIDETPPEPDYWVNQARDCARACSDFTNLLHKIGFPKAHSNPVQTPMVAFACFAVGICSKILSVLIDLVKSADQKRSHLLSLFP